MAKKPKSTKPKPVKAWAGVVDGRIHGWLHMVQPHYEVYKTRADAKKNYEQIVRVQITPLSR